MGVVNRVAEENMAVKLSRIREPLPQFNVGDAIEINVSTHKEKILNMPPVLTFDILCSMLKS